MSKLRAMVSSRPGPWFLALAFLWAWGCWLPLLGFDMTDMSKLPPSFFILAMLGGWGPSLAGLAVRRLMPADRRPRLIARPRPALFALAATTVPLAALLALGANALIGLPTDLGDVASRLPIALLWPLMASFGEEFGWRGLLLPVWASGGRPWKAALGVGLVWGLWHLPSDWIGLHRMGWWFIPQYLLTGLANLTLLSALMTAFWKRGGGDIRLALLCHWSITASAIALGPIGGADPAGTVAATGVSLACLAALTAIAAAIARRIGRSRASASAWAQGDHEADGIRIHYRRTGGAGKRPLVLVHGFTDNGLCWTAVARELEGEYDVIMPDMLGHGLSSRARAGLRLDMPAYLASLIRALGLRRPVVIGHSMGAMIAAQTAARYPELAGALVLEDPPWFAPGAMPGSGPGEDGTPPIVAWAKTLERQTAEELLPGYRRDHPSWPEEMARIMCEAKTQLDPGVIDPLDSALRTQAPDWPSVVGSIRQPMLLITADPALGAIVSPETAARVREIKPDAEAVRIGGAGHLIHFDALPDFMRAVRSFLDRLPTP